MMNKLRILIVEDDQSLLALYDVALPDDRFEKDTAIDGLAALEKYKSWQPDIIILDILLPGMSGYSVLKEIREINEDESTAIIMSSSVDNSEKISYCESCGIQGYIVKPFDYKTLAGEILEYYRDFSGKAGPGP